MTRTAAHLPKVVRESCWWVTPNRAAAPSSCGTSWLGGVVGTLTHPAGKARVTPCPGTVSAPDGACEDEEIAVLSCRPTHSLCATWNVPQPKAALATAAVTRSSALCLSRRALPGRLLQVAGIQRRGVGRGCGREFWIDITHGGSPLLAAHGLRRR